MKSFVFFSASLEFKISFKFLRPNLIIDEQQTQEIIDQQMASIQPFSTRFKSGQIIISKDEIFNEFHIDTLKALNLYGAKNTTINFIGIKGTKVVKNEN